MKRTLIMAAVLAASLFGGVMAQPAQADAYYRKPARRVAYRPYAHRAAYYPVKKASWHAHVQGPTYMNMVSNTEGKVWLSWSFRSGDGGTCHIRYTEVGESVYKYATAASCNDGGVMIGGLVPGQRYKFAVRPDRQAMYYGVNQRSARARAAYMPTGYQPVSYTMDYNLVVAM